MTIQYFAPFSRREFKVNMEEEINTDKFIHTNSRQYFAFNIWDTESAKAVIDAAYKTNQKVILQTSVKVFEVLDKKAFPVFVKSYSREKNVQAYLHLDHCRKIELLQEAAENGWDSVMLDASDKPLDENIRLTNEARAAVKKNVLLEAEVGWIGRTGDGEPALEVGIAEIEDIRRFVCNTDVDMLAIALGTSHGMYFHAPKIHFDLIEKTACFTDLPLVVHGGTGLTVEMFQRLLSYQNIKKINISTDVKLAYRKGILSGMERGLLEETGFDPLKITERIHGSIEEMAVDKLKLLREE